MRPGYSHRPLDRYDQFPVERENAQLTMGIQHNYVHKEVKAEAPSQTASKPTRPTVQANEKRAETMNAKAEDFKPRVNTRCVILKFSRLVPFLCN